MKIILKTALLITVMLSAVVCAQEYDYTRLDSEPYDPAAEPNTDLFISSYKEHKSYTNYGALVERDMFSKSAGDPLHPHEKGAVLTYLNS